MVQSLLTSNEPIYVQHFKSVFEELWKTGTDPDQRIKDIKQGLDQEVIETIEKPAMVQELFFNILRSAKSDIMIILPTVNAFFRHEKLGTLQLAQGAAMERNVRVRILMPRNAFNDQTSEKQMSHQLKKQYSIKYLDIRYTESTETPTASAAKVTLLVADRRSSLVIEIKDDLNRSGRTIKLF
ncbi:MAG TPA: hypothetical protein VFJ51_02500 [Nitrososphaeraceae archaeon]|nr:hypothetical protein [Nitrososphaeraceae archaeon]